MTTVSAAPHGTDFAKDRTFHNTEAPYVLPNDTSEQQRLENQALRFRDLCNDKVFHAPASHMVTITRALDIGCGTGILTNALARMLPKAKVTGIDLTPVPHVREKLPNIEYFTGDFMAMSDPAKVQSPLVEVVKFDYIFSRLLVLGISDWSAYVRRCVEFVKPGGWVEMQDIDMLPHTVPPSFNVTESNNVFRSGTVSFPTFASGHPTDSFAIPPLWFPTLERLASGKGMDIRAGKHLAQLFKDAGLEDIQITRYMCPLGLWGGDGEGLTDAETRFAPLLRPFWATIIPMLLSKLAGESEGVDENEIERAIENALERSKEWDGKKEFKFFYVVCGRKPTG